MGAPDHRRRRDPFEYGGAGVFNDFELHRPNDLSLDNGHARTNRIADSHIGNFEANEVAGPELVVDRKVEHREVAQIDSQFELGTDRPNLFR